MTNRMKVIVAYDGSECADAALDDLWNAGLPGATQFKVLSVVEHWLPHPSELEVVEHIDHDDEYTALASRAVARRMESADPFIGLEPRGVFLHRRTAAAGRRDSARRSARTPRSPPKSK